MKFAVSVIASFVLSASAFPSVRRVSFDLQNGQDAISQKYVRCTCSALIRLKLLYLFHSQQFASLTPNSPCTEGEDACVNGEFAQCVSGKFVLTACAQTTT